MTENSPHIIEDLVEPINLYFHIPVAAKIVTLIKGTSITPNQVTCISVSFGLAAALGYSMGELFWFAIAGIMLEISLILDCVDGQLARAKNCSTDWGRLLDGIGGYVAYVSVMAGLMAGLKGYYYTLIAITIITILKAILFDYCKLMLNSMAQQGYDGSKKEIRGAYRKFRGKPSAILKVYFYYLQFQRIIFHGKWSSLKKYSLEFEGNTGETLLTERQRNIYYQKNRTLMALWKWNGHEFVLFLIALFSLLRVLEESLTILAYLIGIQLFLTLITHQFLIRNEIRS